MRAAARLLAVALLLTGCHREPFEAERATPEALHAREAKGESFVYVAVRSPKAFALSHVKGAVNAPAPSFGKAPSTLPKDRTLVLYCTCYEEHSSLQVAQFLHDREGYSRLLALKGGLAAWKKAGGAIATGSP
jgi:rhodanese-related sulfurtransferase